MRYIHDGIKMKEILFSLSINARKTFSDIGKEIGRSRSNVKKIVNKMEEENILWGYVPVVDERKMGRKKYILLVKYGNRDTFKLIKKSLEAEIKDHVNHPDNPVIFIDSCLVHGAYDFLAKVLASDIVVVKKLVNRLKESYPDFIVEIDILQCILPVRTCGIVNPDLETDVNNILG